MELRTGGLPIRTNIERQLSEKINTDYRIVLSQFYNEYDALIKDCDNEGRVQFLDTDARLQAATKEPDKFRELKKAGKLFTSGSFYIGLGIVIGVVTSAVQSFLMLGSTSSSLEQIAERMETVRSLSPVFILLSVSSVLCVFVGISKFSDAGKGLQNL